MILLLQSFHCNLEAGDTFSYMSVLMRVTPPFVKGKNDAAEMYLGDGACSSKLKLKYLILKASGKAFTGSTVERIQPKVCFVSTRVLILQSFSKITLTQVQKNIWLQMSVR